MNIRRIESDVSIIRCTDAPYWTRRKKICTNPKSAEILRESLIVILPLELAIEQLFAYSLSAQLYSIQLIFIGC